MSNPSSSGSLTPAVTNATCLVGLERIGRLDILPQVFPLILTPPAVQTEVGIIADLLSVQAPQDLTSVAVLKTQVDVGKAEAIALAAIQTAQTTSALVLFSPLISVVPMIHG